MKTKDKISKKDQLSNLLREIELRVRSIRAIAIITKDGLPVSMRLPSDIDVMTFTGIAAALFGATENAMSQIKGGFTRWVYIETDEATVIAMNAEPGILVALISPGANIGLVLIRLKSYIDNIKELLK